jgi:hypothetical protein
MSCMVQMMITDNGNLKFSLLERVNILALVVVRAVLIFRACACVLKDLMCTPLLGCF